MTTSPTSSNDPTGVAGCLVTGAAGFIGYHVCQRLLAAGVPVVGFDNVNDYYDPSLKEQRIALLDGHDRFHFVRGDVADPAALRAACGSRPVGSVIHLAAQAGVRYSLENPSAYVQSNLVGFANILELCRELRVGHLVYASSSSVYGGNRKTPFAVGDPVDHPLNLYAATKKSNELMAHSYSHLYDLPATGVRFFTVYGPWGRPDMAIFKFAELITRGEPIDVYNRGDMKRDFTYIDDIVDGVLTLLDAPPARGEARPSDNGAAPAAPHRVYNLGNSSPVELLRVIDALERAMGATAVRNLLPHQPGDMLETSADMDAMLADFGFSPSVTIEQGIDAFCQWHRDWRTPRA